MAQSTYAHATWQHRSASYCSSGAGAIDAPTAGTWRGRAHELVGTQDADKQLAMCHHADEYEYLSAWCPLDDAHVANGTLVVLPRHCEAGVDVDEVTGPARRPNAHHEASSAAAGSQAQCGVECGAQHCATGSRERTDGATVVGSAGSDAGWADVGAVPMEVSAGDVVLFSSRLWHCSPPNTTDGTRRVLYAQYSVGQLSATRSSELPLCMAVPCAGSCVSSASAHSGNTAGAASVWCKPLQRVSTTTAGGVVLPAFQVPAGTDTSRGTGGVVPHIACEALCQPQPSGRGPHAKRRPSGGRAPASGAKHPRCTSGEDGSKRDAKRQRAGSVK